MAADFEYGEPLGPLDRETGLPIRSEYDDEPLLSPFDLSCWPDTSPPARQWFVRNVIPAGAATVMNGDGGVGKTRIALQGAVAATIGCAFVGNMPDIRGDAVFLSAEMSGVDVWRMLDEVCRGLGLKDQEKRSVAGGLHIIDLAANGSPLLYGVSGWTALGARALATLAKRKPVLTIVDSASSTYSASGFEMAPVYDYMGGFVRAIGAMGSLLMLLHEGKAGLRDGVRTHAYMGSVAWHAAARSRLQLTRDKEDWDRVSIETHKASYSGARANIELVYHEGAFLPPQRDAFIDGIRSNADAKDAVRIISRLIVDGQDASPNMQANNNPAALARKFGLLGGMSSSRLWAGIGQAKANGWLVVEEVKRNRNVGKRLVVTEAGAREVQP